MSIDLFAAFATDPVAEERGTYVKLPDCGEVEFLIARSFNKQYSKLFEKLWTQNQTVLKGPDSDAANKRAEELMVEVMAKTILIGWKGTINCKGIETEYKVEVAAALLSNKDFRERVSKVANDFNTFKTTKDEEEAKN